MNTMQNFARWLALIVACTTGTRTGAAHWLEIGVRANGSLENITLLSLRQQLTPTPYALYAASAGLAESAGSVSGTIPMVTRIITTPKVMNVCSSAAIHLTVVMRLESALGSARIALFGDYGGTGDGRIITDELQINGGSDLSEQFAIKTGAEPGSVVCIDPDNPGQLVVNTKAYDRTVAGIVSGAGGVKPGMMMGQDGTMADGDLPVALSGRVYCRVDASQGAIRPGANSNGPHTNPARAPAAHC